MLIRRQALVGNIRKGHNGAFTVKVALEAVKGEKTLSQLSSAFGVHANQIGQWHKQLLRKLLSLSSDRRRKQDRDQEYLTSELHRQIEQLDKPEARKGGAGLAQEKVPNVPVEGRRKLTDPGQEMIPVCRQWELLRLPRSTYY
jgi:transposase